MISELKEKLKACKTVEDFEAVLGSRRQLSDGEANGVVGGASYKDMTPEGFMEYALALTNALGFGVAQDMVQKHLGVNEGYFRMRMLNNLNYEEYWYSMAVDLYGLAQ